MSKKQSTSSSTANVKGLQPQVQSGIDNFADPPELLNALPDVPGDSQKNVIPRGVQISGVKISFPRWSPLADEFDTEPDVWTVYVDRNRPVATGFYIGGDPVPPDPFPVDIPPVSILQTHGEKDLSYRVVHANGNVVDSLITPVFVDTHDPNLNNQPPAITLPADLSGPVTPAYLAGKLGLVCTIPRLADTRPGDTWHAYFGTADEVGITGSFPATGGAEVIFPTASIMAAGPGDYAIYYTATDRSGNVTQFSFPRTVTVQVSNPPVLGDLKVLEEPLVDKEEARNGVTVRLEDITDYLSTDIVRVFWNGALVDERSVGLFPILPFDFLVTYPTIALPGDEYTADVECTISRVSGGSDSVSTTVDVNLTEPGIGNPGPGPVDDNLEPPTVRGNEGHENRLVEADRNFPAIASFIIPPGLVAGDFIDIYYGTMGGTLASTYPVTGSEAPTFEVALPIAWTIIESYGNGTVPCYYKIRNAVNYKHSPSQDVIVETFSLTGLADPKFALLSPLGTLNCFNTLTPPLAPAPWEGVPVFIKDDVTLEVGDRVIVHAVRYAISDNTTPVGQPVETPEHEVMFNDVQNGFTVTFDLAAWFRDFTGTQGRGFVGVNWSVFRPSTGDRGISDEVQVRWDFRGAYPGGTCVPGSTRASGSL